MVNGFSKTHEEQIPHLGSLLLELQHTTGAKVVSLISQDAHPHFEEFFAITFPTYPKNDMGGPHVTEHLVLSGSIKYPLDDPFFSLMRCSKNTFLNAFTSKLWTSYLAASTISKDLSNILDVYSDAIFHPLLTKKSFLKEGIDLKDTIQGVVYNEMLGYSTDPHYTLWQESYKHLLPGHPYSYNSGGDPYVMWALSHSDLIDFYKTHYHPSNAYIFFFTNKDISPYLKIIDEKISNYTPQPMISMPTIQRFTRPKKTTTTYPPTQNEDKNKMASISWLTIPIADQDRLLAIYILDILMMSTDASPLKKELLKICQVASSHYDDNAPIVPYTIRLEGFDRDIERLEKGILLALQALYEMPFESSWIESSIDQLEFHIREISHEIYPYALRIWEDTIPPYISGVYPTISINKIKRLEKIREKIDERYLKSTLKKYFIDNQSRSLVYLDPSPDHIGKLLQKRDEEIKTYHPPHSEDSSYNKASSNKEVPKLSIADLPKEGITYPLKQKGHTYTHTTTTNGISYINYIFNLPVIDLERLPYLNLLSKVVTQLGTKDRGYEELLHYTQSICGAPLKTQIYISTNKEGTAILLSLSTKCFNKNLYKVIDLLQSFSGELSFDHERMQLLLAKESNKTKRSIVTRSLSYAIRDTEATLSTGGAISYMLHGIPYFNMIRGISLDEIEDLQTMHKSIFQSPPNIIITSDQDINIEYRDPTERVTWKFKIPSLERDGMIIENNLASNVMAIPCGDILSPYAAGLKLSTYLLENRYIHKEVREIGGAYHTSVNYNPLSGIYVILSDKDPNVDRSYEKFYEGIRKLQREPADDEMIEAKISFLREFDLVMQPGNRGIHQYLREISLPNDERERFRKRVLKLSKEDVRDSIEKALIPSLGKSRHSTYSKEDMMSGKRLKNIERIG